MGNRDDGFGSGFGFSGFGASGDPHGSWEGPGATRGVMRDPSRPRRYPEDEMSGSNWSGRAAMSPAERGGYARQVGQGQYGYGQTPWGARDHGGISSYPGDRDQEMGRWSPRERDERSYGEYGRDAYGSRDDSWYGTSGRFGGSRGRGHSGRGASFERGDHDWSPSNDRRYGMSSEASWIDQPWGRGLGGTDMGFAERDEERGPFYGKGPKGYKRSDERIREEICELISRQGFIDASDVEVAVETGIVRLAGTVLYREDKRALEQLSERVHGVDEVRNELRLRRDEHGMHIRQGIHDRSQPHNGKNARS